MPKRMLVADDSITIQKVIELTFTEENFEVMTVGNGALALEKLKQFTPDIILLDVVMPEKNGYEVCDIIKSNPRYARTPVILIVGTFEPFDQERAKHAGMDEFITKPFESKVLIQLVNKLLQQYGEAEKDVAKAAVPKQPLAESAPGGAWEQVQEDIPEDVVQAGAREEEAQERFAGAETGSSPDLDFQEAEQAQAGVPANDFSIPGFGGAEDAASPFPIETGAEQAQAAPGDEAPAEEDREGVLFGGAEAQEMPLGEVSEAPGFMEGEPDNLFAEGSANAPVPAETEEPFGEQAAPLGGQPAEEAAGEEPFGEQAAPLGEQPAEEAAGKEPFGEQAAPPGGQPVEEAAEEIPGVPEEQAASAEGVPVEAAPAEALMPETGQREPGPVQTAASPALEKTQPVIMEGETARTAEAETAAEAPEEAQAVSTAELAIEDFPDEILSAIADRVVKKLSEGALEEMLAKILPGIVEATIQKKLEELEDSEE
jgi:CheY-like chemotaxis protein